MIIMFAIPSPCHTDKKGYNISELLRLADSINHDTSAMTSESPGLHSSSHLLGVIPLVLFWNLSGNISAKSRNLEVEKMIF